MPQSGEQQVLQSRPTPGRSIASMTLGRIALFLLVIEAVTGVLLMTVYSPSTTMAWGSVWYIQDRMTLGWLVRGLHRFASDALVAVSALFLLQLVACGTYQGSRRIWWSVLALLFVVMAAALSGFALPWDQHGYWGTKVRTNILALTPLIGSALRAILIGGSDLGNLTLTRFYALHAVVLPVCAAVLILAGSRRSQSAAAATGNGRHADTTAHGRRLAHAVIAALVLAGLLVAAILVHETKGGELLTAPADPSSTNYAARPEWFNLFLYQWLKGFHGPWLETLGAVIVPGLVVLAFVLFPYTDRWLPPWRGRAATIGFTSVITLALGWLTYAAIEADRNPPDRVVEAVRARQRADESLSPEDRAVLQARAYHNQLRQSRANARRAIELARSKGIPPDGPLPLLANDPMTRGPELFAANCSSCHRFDGHNGMQQVPSEPASSSDLAGFASRSWIRGLLTDPMSDHYFGRMKKPDGSPAHTQMRDWVAKKTTEYEADGEIDDLHASFDAVAAYLEDESLHPGRLQDVSPYSLDEPPSIVAELEQTRSGQQILDGRQFFMLVCNECHRYGGVSSGLVDAPEMLGYGSIDWIEQMIAEPDGDLRYGREGKEPAQMLRFQDRLSESDRRLIATWIHSTRRIQSPSSATPPAPGTGGE